MSTDTARARHQQRVEELCAAAIRALCGETDLHFRGGRLHRAESPVVARAPHLSPRIDQDDFGSFRGAADGMSLRILHSDPALHQALAPAGTSAGLVFEMLEQFRVESLAGYPQPGVVANLRHRHVAWSRAFHASGLTETAQGLLIYTVAQISRSRVTAEPVLADTEDLLEGTRFRLTHRIGPELAALRRCRADQAAYAVPARSIAEKVAELVAQMSSGDTRSEVPAGSRTGFSLFPEGDDQPQIATAVSGGGSAVAGEGSYRVFTRAYDREDTITDLVRVAQLHEYRARLDDLVQSAATSVHGLARRLRSLLAEPAQDGWDSGQETGLIDGRSLTRLITAPRDHRLFRSPRSEPVADCLVTVLVDCSGSMRRHHESVATIIDLLVRALDLADVTSEVLGFTTGAWNGGRAMRDWKRAGRPPHPGRLNERQHLVFKSAEESWRRARPGIAGLLRQDLYREALDGEAVAWACSRMRGRPESRRLLVVMSDGSPMDSATSLGNGPHYLDRNLRDVVRREERSGPVRILGLGVGLDLSPFYSLSQALDLDGGVDPSTLREVVALLDAEASGRRR